MLSRIAICVVALADLLRPIGSASSQMLKLVRVMLIHIMILLLSIRKLHCFLKDQRLLQMAGLC